MQNAGSEMAEEEDMACEECGFVFKEGDEVISQASGTWRKGRGMVGGHAELGDHFIMHQECPEEQPV